MEKPLIKDRAVLLYVEHIEKELKKYVDSPYADTYLTILTQIESFNDQLKTQTVDLFGDKDEKAFDRSWKYMLESVDMVKKLDELRKLMSPEDLKELQKQVDLSKLGMAERMALNSKNGKS